MVASYTRTHTHTLNKPIRPKSKTTTSDSTMNLSSSSLTSWCLYSIFYITPKFNNQKLIYSSSHLKLIRSYCNQFKRVSTWFFSFLTTHSIDVSMNLQKKLTYDLFNFFLFQKKVSSLELLVCFCMW